MSEQKDVKDITDDDLFDSDSDQQEVTELDRLFNHATGHVRQNAGKMNKDHLLYLYSRYKYATEGPCQGSRPSGVFNFDGKAKYDSWKALGSNKTKEECKQEYVDKLDQVAAGWRAGYQPGEKKKPSGGQAGTFGVKMSMMAQPVEENIDASSFDVCKQDDLEKVKTTLNKSNVDQVDESEMTGLMWACDRGNLPIVKYLIEDLGADVNKQDGEGQTCLHYAVSCEHIELVKYLTSLPNMNKEISDNDGLRAVDLTQDGEMVQLFQ